MNTTKRTRERERAFTLVELLLVVTIIGILAGAVLVNLGGQSQRARETRARLDIANFSAALDRYEIELGTYPTTDQGLDALVDDPGVPGWNGPYVGRRTFRDPWGRDYQYRYPGTRGINYDLYTLGADGQEGTDDDIGNWDEDF